MSFKDLRRLCGILGFNGINNLGVIVDQFLEWRCQIVGEKADAIHLGLGAVNDTPGKFPSGMEGDAPVQSIVEQQKSMVVTMLDLSLLSHQLAQGFDQFFFVLSGHFFHDGNLNNFTNMAGVQHFF